jgi:hypothetical protein
MVTINEQVTIVVYGDRINVVITQSIDLDPVFQSARCIIITYGMVGKIVGKKTTVVIETYHIGFDCLTVSIFQLSELIEVSVKDGNNGFGVANVDLVIVNFHRHGVFVIRVKIPEGGFYITHRREVGFSNIIRIIIARQQK